MPASLVPVLDHCGYVAVAALITVKISGYRRRVRRR
jgi:hypothetical protein